MRTGWGAERGAIIIWAVFALFVVGALAAISINIGRMLSVRGGLQNGADAAALAAAAELDGQLTGIAEAQAAAVALAGLHQTDSGQSIVIDPINDVIFGSWDRDARLFTPIPGRTEADLRAINAVRVLDGRETARGNAVPVVFGGAFVTPRTADVVAFATAVGGGPAEDECAFPVAIADCMFVNEDGSLRCDDRYFVLNSDWQDNIGLTSLEPGVPASVTNIKAALDQCIPSHIGEPIPISNGNPLQPISQDTYFNLLPRETIAPVVHVDRCPPAQYQKCVSTSPTDPCVNAKFVGDLVVEGYVTVVVCYVTGAQVKQWPPADWPVDSPDCGQPPTIVDFPGVDPSQWPDPFLKQTLFMKHKCERELPGDTSGTAGGGFFGTSTPRAQLVE